MAHFRLIPLAVAFTAAIALTACNTTPAMMPMGSAPAGGMATPEQMGRMEAHMKSMRAIHDRMMSAKTPEERNQLMAEHMKTMRDGMAMMEGMSGAGMPGMHGMPGDMAARHQMMEKRMEMMQTMMKMMMERMPATPAQ